MQKDIMQKVPKFNKKKKNQHMSRPSCYLHKYINDYQRYFNARKGQI